MIILFLQIESFDRMVSDYNQAVQIGSQRCNTNIPFQSTHWSPGYFLGYKRGPLKYLHFWISRVWVQFWLNHIYSLWAVMAQILSQSSHLLIFCFFILVKKRLKINFRVNVQFSDSQYFCLFWRGRAPERGGGPPRVASMIFFSRTKDYETKK